MQAMDAALERLVSAGTVKAADALEKALDKDTFSRLPTVAAQLGTNRHDPLG